MPQSTWREQARAWITLALDEGRRRGLEGKELRRFVKDNGRGHIWAGGAWGLKMWRQEFNTLVRGAPPRGRSGGVPRRRADAPGQLDLF